MIDIHNHLLIGVDDGPADEAATYHLLLQAVDQGITDILITPHHYSGDWRTPKDKVMTEIKRVESIIAEHQLPVRVYPGQEIRINDKAIEELASGYNMSLNSSRYVLIEFPFNNLPFYVDNLMYELQLKGYTPLIAHPERCKPIIKQPDKLFNLVEKGAIAQVTGSSVTGDLGDNLQETSLEMIRNHLVHIIGSDAHHHEVRPFKLAEAYQVVEDKLGREYVDYLKFNAEAILHNKDVRVKAPRQMESHYTADRKRTKKKFFGLF